MATGHYPVRLLLSEIKLKVYPIDYLILVV